MVYILNVAQPTCLQIIVLIHLENVLNLNLENQNQITREDVKHSKLQKYSSDPH